MKKLISVMIFILISTTMFVGCKSDPNPQSSEIFVMSTFVTQKVYGKDKKAAVENVNKALVDIEKQLSLYIEGSDIDVINKNAGIKPVKVNSYTYELMKYAKDLSSKSGGYFDISIAPLTLLWGVNSSEPKVPTQEELNKILPLVDYNNIVLDDKEQTVFLKKQEMAIDLGGIAKGYVANIIKSEYDKLKIDAALVSIGGNIFAYKTKPDKSEFKVGLQKPIMNKDNDIFATFSIKDKVVATTGAYERYFEKDGKFYHHILDPKTGYPAQTDIISATIISSDGGLADYLSTTLFMAGTKNIEKYINHDKFEVVIVDKDNNVYISDSLKGNFELTSDEYKLAQ